VLLVTATQTRAGVVAGNRYAMKILDKKKFEAQRIVRYAYGERNVLKAAKHPFLIQLHCAFEVLVPSPQWILVMEFAPGGSLYEKIIREGKPGLPGDSCRRYAAEILEGLSYLHKRNIIYRDLKPENVVLSVRDHCKITDFGLAKMDVDVRGAQSYVGSHGYAAPEVGKTRYTSAVDLFSLGVTLFMMTSGGISRRHGGTDERSPVMNLHDLVWQLQLHLPEPGGGPTRFDMLIAIPRQACKDGVSIVSRARSRQAAGDFEAAWLSELQEDLNTLVQRAPGIATILAEHGWTPATHPGTEGGFTGPPDLKALRKALYPPAVAVRLDVDAVDLMLTLTNRSVVARGTDESTKRHKFFAGIDWDSLVPSDELAASEAAETQQSAQEGGPSASWSFAGP